MTVGSQFEARCGVHLTIRSAGTNEWMKSAQTAARGQARNRETNKVELGRKEAITRQSRLLKPHPGAKVI